MRCLALKRFVNNLSCVGVCVYHSIFLPHTLNAKNISYFSNHRQTGQPCVQSNKNVKF